jgi:hypothetical protein
MTVKSELKSSRWHHGPSSRGGSSKKRRRRKAGGVVGVKVGDLSMEVDGKGLGEEISEVEKGGEIGEVEEVLTDSITEPVKAHVHRLGLLGTNRGMGEANSALVVTKYRRGGLRIAEVLEGSAEEAGGLGVDKGGSKFGFSSRGDNNRDMGG